VPSGTASSLYYVSVRVWRPGFSTSLSRQWYDSPADLRSTTSVSLPIAIK
jgi:hypothetical protein